MSRICYIDLHGTAVRQLRKRKLARFILETGVEYVTSNCMGRAVRLFKKENSCRLGTGAYIELYGTRGSPCSKKKLILDYEHAGEVLRH